MKLNKLILIFFVLIINSCKEESSDSGPDNSLIEKAKLHFQSKTGIKSSGKSFSTKSAEIELNKKLFWEEATTQDLFGTQVVVVPVNVDKMLSIKKEDGSFENIANQNQMYFYKNAADEWIEEFVVRIPDQDFLRQNNWNKKFRGKVLVHNWEGKLIKGYEFKADGKVYKLGIKPNTSANKGELSVKEVCNYTDYFYCISMSVDGSHIGTKCTYEYTTYTCTDSPPQETLEGGDYGNGNGGSTSTIGNTFDPSLIPGGPGKRPKYEFIDKCAGLKYAWEAYPQNEVHGYITSNGAVIVAAIGSYDWTTTQGLYQQDGKFYYVYPTSQGAPINNLNATISRDHYFIPISSSFHTHAPCRNDGTNGVSHDVSGFDKNFAFRHPGLPNFVIGCDAIAQFENADAFFNVQTGSLSTLCNNIY